MILKMSKYPRRLITMYFFKTLISQPLISDKYWLFLSAEKHKQRLNTEPESSFELKGKKFKLHFKVVNPNTESIHEWFSPT